MAKGVRKVLRPMNVTSVKIVSVWDTHKGSHPHGDPECLYFLKADLQPPSVLAIPTYSGATVMFTSELIELIPSQLRRTSCFWCCSSS